MALRVPTAAQPEEYITCKLSRGRCLIPLTALYEVIQPPHRFALLPATPQWMPGVVAWRGETIAVIDLDAYLFPASSFTGGKHTSKGNPANWGPSDRSANPPGEGTLLMANLVSYGGLAVGLLVPGIVEQTAPLQSEEMVPFLDMPSLLVEMVQQIENAASYG